MVAARPGSNQPGVFPRKALAPSEAVLFETRPALLAEHRWAIGIPAGIILLFGVVLLSDVASGQGSIALFGGFGFLLGILLLPILFAVVRWLGTAYALTDQRVLVVRGGEYTTAAYGELQGVTIAPNSTNLVFEPAPGPARPSPARDRLVWSSVPYAPAIVIFAESVIQFYRLRFRQATAVEKVVSDSMAHEIACPYCGQTIDLKALPRENPSCPYCSAPLSPVAGATG